MQEEGAEEGGRGEGERPRLCGTAPWAKDRLGRGRRWDRVEG